MPQGDSNKSPPLSLRYTECCEHAFLITDTNGQIFAHNTGTTSYPAVHTREQAEHLVNACNSHNALKEALLSLIYKDDEGRWRTHAHCDTDVTHHVTGALANAGVV